MPEAEAWKKEGKLTMRKQQQKTA